MIVFLTLCYIAVLALLVKLGVIKFTLWWKISPAVWMLLLLIILFLPMQWGAPAGDLLVLNYIIEIVPNVTGEVTEVPVEPLTPIEKGDVLFQIDRRQFQAEVNRLEAALAAAEQDVPQLKATFDAASASLTQSTAQRDLAQLNYDRAVSVREKNAGAISELQVDQTRQSLAAAVAAVDVDEANKEKARLAWKTEIDGENTRVAELKAQLEAARLDLNWTTVRAPTDGMVISLFLRPGQRVANLPLRSWLAFQDRSSHRVVVFLPQYALRHVKPGQTAEVVFKFQPGKTFSATVDAVAPLNSEGQVQASGILPVPSSDSLAEQQFVVVLEFDDERIDDRLLAGGAVGSAAIYTDNAKATHVIRRVMMRMKTWMNYIVP